MRSRLFLFSLFKLTVVSVLLVSLLGCQGVGAMMATHREAKGKVKYGGVFHINETEYFRSLFPQNVTETEKPSLRQSLVKTVSRPEFTCHRMPQMTPFYNFSQARAPTRGNA